MGSSRRLTMLPDHELVTRVQAGDVDAFENLVERHQLPLRHFFLRRCEDPALVDDLVQSTFMTTFVQLHQLRDQHAFLGWFYRIAHNTLVSEARRQKARPAASLEALIADGGVPDELSYLPAAIERFPEHDLISQALNSMNPLLREAFMLRHFAQCPASEIAEVLAVPVPTARKRIARANEYVRVWCARFDTAEDESVPRYA